MKQSIESIKSLEKKMDAAVTLPHQAVAIGFALFQLMTTNNNFNIKIELLLERFFKQLNIWGFKDLINIQADYVIKISSYDGKLEYEEMNKLFSLCDEIYALEYLGLKLNKQKKIKLEERLRSRFSLEKKNANIAAKQNSEQWNKDFWWYKENFS